MMSVFVAMSVFALVGAITPGPVNVLAVRHGAAQRVQTPLLFVLGASVSYTLVVWLMGTGAQQLVLNNPGWVRGVQWLGAAYLLYLAGKIATAPVAAQRKNAQTQSLGAWAVFSQGFAVQALNPKAWLVALAGVGLFVLPQNNVRTALLGFCVVSLLACFLGVGTWAVLGRTLATWLQAPERQVRFNRVLALLLALSVVGMLA